MCVNWKWHFWQGMETAVLFESWLVAASLQLFVTCDPLVC